jgi:deoxyribonuclease-4
MLIGAHVSPAGGPANAVRRGQERHCEAIQIFNQSPRAWQARRYSDQELSDFHRALAESSVKGCVIHAIYLLNCASEDPEIRSKSLAALTLALQSGAALGALGVVLHPGSAKQSDPVKAIKRAGATIAAALAQSEGCELHLENTAGAGGTLGRSVEELAALYEAIGEQRRVGICLDSCHLFASGYDLREAGVIAQVRGDLERKIGKGCVRSLHLNDSQAPLGSNRDRHANLGEGELGLAGLRNFLGERGLQRLPCILETPGARGTGASAQEVELARKLHAEAR